MTDAQPPVYPAKVDPLDGGNPPRGGSVESVKTVKAVKAPDVSKTGPEPAPFVSGLRVSIPCTAEGCTGALLADPKHADNLAPTYLCSRHRGGDAA